MSYIDELTCTDGILTGGVSSIMKTVNDLVVTNKSKITHLVPIGASITEDAFEEPELNDIDKIRYGLDGLIIKEEGVSGNTVADILARLPAIIEKYKDYDVFYPVHAMGNDVTNSRPFSSMTDAEKYTLGNTYRQIIDLLIASGKPFMLANISYRNYSDVPPESNGSLPYNENIVNTAIKTYCPDFWDFETGKPLYNMYDLFKDNPSYLLADGVHPTTEGRQAIRDLVLNIVSKFFYVDTTIQQKLSGNTVVVDFAATPAVQTNAAINTIEITTPKAICHNTFSIGGLTVETDATWLSGDQGRGNSGDTSSSWENSDALLSYFYANDATPRITKISGAQPGATATLYFSASRASDDGLRLMDVTYNGITKIHNAGANPPEAISFDVTFDSDGVVEFTTKRNSTPLVAFCYMSVIQIAFD